MNITFAFMLIVAGLSFNYQDFDILSLAEKAQSKSASQITKSSLQDDILSLAEDALAKPSPVLFKIKDEINKNNPEIPASVKSKVPDKVITKFKLFVGQFSNTADLKGGGTGTDFNSLEEAMNAARLHMSSNAGKQPSFRIEDQKGKVLKAQGVFKKID